MTTEERCAEIEGRIGKTKPGPWTVQGPYDRIPKDDSEREEKGDWIEDGYNVDGIDSYGDYECGLMTKATAEFIAHARDDLPWAIAEIRRLRQWVHDLQAGMYINCVYCGHRYGPDDQVPATMAQALKEHVERCPEHPMAALREERDRLRTAMEEARTSIEDAGPR